MRLLIVSTFLLLTITASAQTLRKFVGTWRVDEDKSQEKAVRVKNPPSGAPQIPPPPPAGHRYTLERIRQSGRILKVSGGEAGTTAVYTIDPSGKQVSDAIPDAPGVVRIASSHWDGEKTVTTWQMKRNGEMFMDGTDTREVTPDGRLILQRMIKSSSHSAEVRLVFDKIH